MASRIILIINTNTNGPTDDPGSRVDIVGILSKTAVSRKKTLK